MTKVILCFFLSIYYQADAQTGGEPRENPGAYYNSFQKYLYSNPNQDSALYNIRKLAANPAYDHLLKDLLHNSFAQEFRQKNEKLTDTSAIDALNQKRNFSKDLLVKMASDTNETLKQAVRPLYLYTKAQDDSSNVVALANLTNNFISQELSSGNIYENRRARYGLLIYHIISKHAALQPLAKRLQQSIWSNLKSNQITFTDSTSRAELEKRAWYRYLYSYASYLEANETKDNDKAMLLLKTAFDFSPDLIDQNYSSSYYYDMIFLFGGEKESFRDDYLNFLMNTSANKNTVLTALLETALTTPGYKSKLKEYYDRNTSSGKPFEKYWAAAINEKATKAPSIFLTLLNGKPFRSSNLLGRWVLVDFWGTWCLPCRAEHPDLEKFYQTAIQGNSTNISLLTIACSDTYNSVSAYIKQKKFSFPVAMSDNKIENSYGVQGYPTKILITPEGKYMVIPFGSDWMAFVKQYTGL